MQLTSEGLITLDKRTELKPYLPRPFIEREFMTDIEIQANVGSTLFVNVESYPNFFLITFKLHNTNKFIQLECGENKSFNPRLLAWIMQNYRTVGFNSINYDLLLIWLSYHYQDAEILKNATNDIILRNIREWELKKQYKFQTFTTNHIDLIEVAPLKGSLKLYGARLHTKSIQEQPFDINANLTEFEIGEIKKFNCNQLCITQELFNFMKERLELREAMSNEYHENLMSKSDAQIAEVIISKEVAKLNGKYPKRQDISYGATYRYSTPDYINYQTPDLINFLGKLKIAKFTVQPNGKIAIPDELEGAIKIGKNYYRVGIGGLHSSEKCVAYKANENLAIVDRDVQSYYPRIVTNLKLYPISMGSSFLEAYEKIIKTRLDAKERKLLTKDKGLKIVINGAGGKFSDIWSTLYSPDLTIQMTITGQLTLLLLIEMLELVSIEVISANTDGIVMLVKKEQEQILQNAILAWERNTNFITEETRYVNYYARDCNAYFATKIDGKVKIKGSYSEIGSASATKLDTNPIVLICSDAVEALISKNIPIEETILNCKDFTRFVNIRQAKAPGAHKNGEYLGRVLRWYYAKGETRAIHTVAANNKVAGSDGAKPCLDLPDSFPDDIDYNWYIKHTKEILEDIGYTPRMKQVDFF